MPPITRQLAIALASAAPSVVSAQCGPAGCPVVRHPDTATVAPSPGYADAIARVVCRGAGGASLGTGTLVATTADASYFVTCAHVLDDPGQVFVVLRGESAAAEPIAVDRRHDVALLRTRPVGATPVAIAALERGAPLTACGFGSTGELRCVRGVVTGFSTASGADHPSLRLRGSVRPGDSGGPVLDAAGRLVAVVWGERDGETYAMTGEPLRRVLARLPRLQPAATPPQATAPTIDHEEAWRKRIEERIEALASDRTPAAPSVPPDAARREELEALAADWEARFEGVSRAMPGACPSLVATLVGWFVTEPAIASVAVGGPLGVGVWLLAGWLRRSTARRTSEPATRTVIVDSPPPPQRVVPETHFVSYERDDFARAHQWATEQLARKFPGSVEMLTSLDSLIRQQLNGSDSEASRPKGRG